METETNLQLPIIEQHDSIKLIKGSKGTYNWEIRILSLDVKKLELLNKEMLVKFGGQLEKGIWTGDPE